MSAVLEPTGVQHHNLDDIRQRARGAFVGLLLGDALGATVEFLTRAEIRAKHGVHREIVGGGWLGLEAGQVTDDSEMSFAIARSIVAAGGWSLPSAAQALAVWMRGKPRDIGNTVRRGLASYLATGRLQMPENVADGGNGAAVRVLPIALANLGDPEATARSAIEQARITHHHPFSDAACITLARMLQHAVLGRSMLVLKREADALVARHPTFRYSPYAGLASGYVVDTMQTVLRHFLRSRDYEDCLVAVVNEGGDADSTGAIAGMLAGAYCGPWALPHHWRVRLKPGLEHAAIEFATSLVELSPLRQRLAPAHSLGQGLGRAQP